MNTSMACTSNDITITSMFVSVESVWLCRSLTCIAYVIAGNLHAYA